MEQVKFKNVAHLYLTPVDSSVVPIELCIKHGDKHFQHRSFFQEIESGLARVGGKSFPYTNRFRFEDIKPILRPLSDATQEERERITDLSPLAFRQPWEFRYLLSRGFDLFNLIESRQAIDATKI